MIDTYDVVICGAGPTGVLLAAYLSRSGGVKVTKFRLN
jgi:2-polyprenyl-6-methoxyphenol hydroxylase-like FAD-dependent oxidoreductase